MDDLTEKWDILLDYSLALELQSSEPFFTAKVVCRVQEDHCQLIRAKNVLRLRGEQQKKVLHQAQKAMPKITSDLQRPVIPGISAERWNDVTEPSSATAESILALQRTLDARGFSPELDIDAMQSLRQSVDGLRTAHSGVHAEAKQYHDLPANIFEANAFIQRFKVHGKLPN